MFGIGKSWKSIQAKYMTELAERIATLHDRIEDDVKEMCLKVLKPFREEYKREIKRKESTEKLDSCLQDIIRSLRIHVSFHCGQAELSMAGTEIDTDVEMEEEPPKEDEYCWTNLAKFKSDLGLTSNQEEGDDPNFVIDPGSLLLEMVSWEAARKLRNWYWNVAKRECYNRRTREENEG